MEKFLTPYAAQAYAVMRIVVGLLFLCHGLQKVFGLFGGVNGAPAPLLSLFGIAGLIELVTGALIVVGWFAGSAAFLASGQMAAAYFIGHASQGTPLVPMLNKGELAALYAFVFLYFAVAGSGSWALDNVIRRKRDTSGSLRVANA